MMKLLLFSDLHRNVEAARSIVERSREVDVVVGAGDFATVRRGIRECIEVLRAIETPTVLVAGNNESTEELSVACSGWSMAHVLHGSGTTIEGIDFWGLPGGVPVTPFGPWSHDFTEEQAAAMLAGCPVGAVLVSHSPPKGMLDQTSSGMSVGSESVRSAMIEKQLRLVVCGHIHDSCGKAMDVEGTVVVNAGPEGMVREFWI